MNLFNWKQSYGIKIYIFYFKNAAFNKFIAYLQVLIS